jgi:hypothetical protein
MRNKSLSAALLMFLTLPIGGMLTAQAQAGPRAGGGRPGGARPGMGHRPTPKYNSGRIPGGPGNHRHMTRTIYGKRNPITPRIGAKALPGTRPVVGYASRYGVRLSGGAFAYKGRDHRHWTRRHFSPAWGAWFWYDAGTTGWYYWSAPQGHYLPVSYLATVAPTTDEEPPTAENVDVASSEEAPDLPEPE